MTERITNARLAVILLFTISFTLMGWVAPVMYASYAPTDHIIEAHSFEAQDTHPSADSHYLFFDRTMKQATSGQVFTELYLVSDRDPNSRTEIESRTMERYFQQGRHEVITPLSLPKDLDEGKYRYLLVVKLDMADGRVERAFTFTSETFNVSEDVPEPDTDRPITC